MKLRTKLATLIAAFVLVAALTVVGVLAVNNATVNLGGTVNFVATDIKATVTGTVTGTSTAVTLPNLVYTASSTPSSSDLEAWDDLEWNFASKTTDIVLTITVTNNSTERALSSNLAAATPVSGQTFAGKNISVTTAVTNPASGASVGSDYEVAVGQSITYTITFSIVDQNLSVSSAGWESTLTLENVTAGA